MEDKDICFTLYIPEWMREEEREKRECGLDGGNRKESEK